MNRDEAALVRRLALEEAAEALRKLALERGAITVMHMQECLRALAQVPAQSRYCGACEQYVTEPCSSIDCSTPEFCKSQEQQAPEPKPCQACDPSVGYTCEEHGEPEQQAPAVQEDAEQVVTEEMVTAYLAANTAYWQQQDELPLKNPSKWRNGTPQDATRFSLEAALRAASNPAPAQTGEKTK